MWFDAARSGDLDTLKICLFWKQPVNALSREGRTALSLAASGGHAAAVALLLERRADPNLHGPGGLRPLTAAVAGEHWDVAAALVRAGADPNADGVASIVVAEPPKRQLLALMFRHGLDPHGSHAEWGPYILFALNDPACADMFVGAGFDLPRHERETGESLLERALSGGLGRLLHLLSLGANVDLPVDRRTGRTLLMTVAAEEPPQRLEPLLRLLVKRGADLERRDADGRTALDYATARSDKAAVGILTRLRNEKARADKALAKAAAAAEAKAERERRAAAKKTAAAATAARRVAKPRSRKTAKGPTAKRRRATTAPPTPLPPRSTTSRGRGKTAEHAASAKWTPDAPSLGLPGSAAEAGEPVPAGATRGFDEA